MVIERMPYWASLLPLVLQWIGLGLRYRSFTLPSSANPGITAGGLVGDRKSEYFNRMGVHARAWLAPYALIEPYGAMSRPVALEAMRATGLRFPVIAKPDLGWCGYGVCRIDSADALDTYLAHYPHGAALLLQRYLPESGEAGIFYVREPGHATGRIVGLLLRHPPEVIGDGIHTVAELLEHDRRLSQRVGSPRHRYRYNPARIPRAGHHVRLSTIGSYRIGARYEDGLHHLSDTLTNTIDGIARDMPHFHVGRLDVRYASVHDLRHGRFTIMEINGAGSEAGQAWDPKYTLREAYRIVFAKQRLLFAVGALGRARGHRPIGLVSLARLWRRQQALIRQYPASN